MILEEGQYKKKVGQPTFIIANLFKLKYNNLCLLILED